MLKRSNAHTSGVTYNNLINIMTSMIQFQNPSTHWIVKCVSMSECVTNLSNSFTHYNKP